MYLCSVEEQPAILWRDESLDCSVVAVTDEVQHTNHVLLGLIELSQNE